MIQEIIKQYHEGNLKASKAYVSIRSIKSEAEDAIKELESGLIEEIIMMGNEDLVVEGNKISHIQGRIIYNYKSSDVWVKAKHDLSIIEEKLKQATKLKSDIVDSATGEVYEQIPIKQASGFIKMERARMEVVK